MLLAQLFSLILPFLPYLDAYGLAKWWGFSVWYNIEFNSQAVSLLCPKAGTNQESKICIEEASTH
jgi:hypothetical protein